MLWQTSIGNANKKSGNARTFHMSSMYGFRRALRLSAAAAFLELELSSTAKVGKVFVGLACLSHKHHD
jgi:hypothetical protein